MNEPLTTESNTLIVETYPGYKGEPTPGAFTHAGIRLEVREISAHWETERYSFFKVRAGDGYQYTLRHHLDDLTWELLMQEQ
jgi:hypothetical protein